MIKNIELLYKLYFTIWGEMFRSVASGITRNHLFHWAFMNPCLVFRLTFSSNGSFSAAKLLNYEFSPFGTLL